MGLCGRRSPTCNDIIVALAESGEQQTFGRQAEPLQLRFEEVIERVRCGLDTFSHLLRVQARYWKPLISRAGTALGAIRRREGHGRKQPLPVGRQSDQVVSVRTIAVAENDEMTGAARAAGNRGPVSAR